jgi:hypothetical protein
MSESKVRKPVWLIVCAAVMILTAIFHTIAQLQEQRPSTPQEKQLLELITTVKLSLPGTSRTFNELFQGFNWLMSGSCVGFALVALVMIGERPRVRRRVALVIALTMGLYTAISLVYFFIIPIGCFGLACGLAVLSLLLDPKEPAGA